MRSQRRIRHAEAVDEFTVGNDDNFFGKPLSSEKNGELVARWSNNDKTLPRIAAATAFNACKFRVERLQGREADKTTRDPLFDLLALIVVSTNSALAQKQFIVAGKGDNALARFA